MPTDSRAPGARSRARALPSSPAALAMALAAAGLGGAPLGAAAAPAFQVERVPLVDKQLGIPMGTVAIPKGWKLTYEAQWRYQDVSAPFRLHARVESPDGKAWLESFPNEIFYWIQPRGADPTPPGQRVLGMVHAPNGIEIDGAMEAFLVRAHRPGVKYQVVRKRPVHGMARAFGIPQLQGQERAVHIRYTKGGKTVDEEFFAALSQENSVPSPSPVGTWYEHHKALLLSHVMGASDGELEHVRPVLEFIAKSTKPDPVWQKRHEEVTAQIARQFQANIQAGYEKIAAAGAMSRQISAQNDAMLARMDSSRKAQAQADAVRRANQATGGGSSEFDSYIRGTTKMKDPYWGESEQSSNYSYHWTDGQGNYRASNDPTFDPNIGGGGPNWQRMETAGK